MSQTIDLTNVVSSTTDGVIIRVKVVPGSSRDRISGLLGDRLKLAVAAPPEGGKANKAVCALIAQTLGIAKRDVAIIDGQTRPQKTIEALGVSLCHATEHLQKRLTQ